MQHVVVIHRSSPAKGEASEPFIDLHIQLNLIPGREQDQGAAAERPGPPSLVEEE